MSEQDANSTAETRMTPSPLEVFSAGMEAEVHRRVVGDRRHGLTPPAAPAEPPSR